LTDITFTGGPFLAENTTATTITPSATAGTVTLTASSSIWNADHVGALWQIVHTVDANTVSGNFTATGTSSTVTVQEDRSFDFSTHGTWTGTILLQRSFDAGSTWKDVTSFTSAADGNLSYGDSETVADATYRVNMSAYTSGTCNYTLIARSHDIEGEVTIATFSSGTSVTATVTSTLGDTTAVSTWSEGAWSADEGFPSVISFYEERQAYAGTANSPQTIWLSATDDWDNFDIGTGDSDAKQLTLASDQVNVIRWISVRNELLVGTIGEEWAVSLPEDTDPIIPKARIQSRYGSSSIQPITVGDSILFVQRPGEKVRSLNYKYETESWFAPDITILSEHITDSGIVNIALQKAPYQILWCVLDDGDVAALAMEENNDVIGWHKHTFDGDVESVAVITSSGEDEVWFSVERTINGSTKRYVEQLQPFDWGADQEDVFFVDCGLTSDGGSSVTVTNITQASPAVVTAASHGFSNGDQVRFSSVGGMTEVNDNVYTVASAATDNFALQDSAGVGNVDSSGFTAYTSGGTVIQVEKDFTGADHLEGEAVYAIGDGGYGGSYTISSGDVSTDDWYTVLHVGIPYTAKLQTVRLESRANSGRLFSKNKRITDVSLRLNETLDCDVGPSWTLYESIAFREATDLLDQAVPLYSGDKLVAFEGDYETDGYIYIQSGLPVPMCVLALRAEVEVYE
jgi:hypothetical protein